MTRQRVSMAVGVVAALVVAGGVIFAVRSDDDRSAAAPRPSASSVPPVRVVLPGSPGDEAKVSDSDQIELPEKSVYNAVDTAFVQMMIVHHRQAIEMAKLSPERAASADLRAFAERIAIVQDAEITYLRSWLSQRRLPESDPSHDHGQMAGMQTPENMAALAGLRGAEFDRKFVTMMTDHHEGALRMASDVVTDGTDELLREVAEEMSAEQGSEIRRMEQMKLS